MTELVTSVGGPKGKAPTQHVSRQTDSLGEAARHLAEARSPDGALREGLSVQQ